jgi:chorismate synthase
MSKRRKITPQIDATTDKQDEIIKQLTGSTPSKPDAAVVTNEDTDSKKTVRVTLDIPKPLHARIKAHTKARGQSIKGYLLFLASQDMD